MHYNELTVKGSELQRWLSQDGWVPDAKGMIRLRTILPQECEKFNCHFRFFTKRIPYHVSNKTDRKER